MRYPDASALVFVLVTALVGGCASGPDVGVRQDYRRVEVPRVAVVPFWSDRPRSADLPMTTLLETAQRTVTRWVAARQIDALPPETVAASLQRAEAWQNFQPDGAVRRNLPSRAGKVDRTALRAAIERLVALHGTGAFPTRWVLVGQILYHSATTCWTRADDYSPRASVVVTSNAPSGLPRPCVVSHLQARLIDTRTGATVWFNRQMRELHLGHSPTRDDQVANVRAATLELLESKDGLTGLMPAP